jgi:hypothetical protein
VSGDECALCAAADRSELIERVAAAMWDDRRTAADDPAWADAGDYWQASFRALATSAVEALRSAE